MLWRCVVMVCCRNVVLLFRYDDGMLLLCLLFDVGWRLCVVRCSCSRFVACDVCLLFVFAIYVEVVCCFLFGDVRCACCVACCCWLLLVISGLLFVGCFMMVVFIVCYWVVCCLLLVAWCSLFVRCCVSVVCCWWFVC